MKSQTPKKLDEKGVWMFYGLCGKMAGLTKYEPMLYFYSWIKGFKLIKTIKLSRLLCPGCLSVFSWSFCQACGSVFPCISKQTLPNILTFFDIYSNVLVFLHVISLAFIEECNKGIQECLFVEERNLSSRGFPAEKLVQSSDSAWNTFCHFWCQCLIMSMCYLFLIIQ